MENVSRTLYIPLYGKALVSRLGLLLRDPDAEKLWDAAGISLKGKSASKWLAYTMGMRSAVFDNWLRGSLTEDAVVLHLGCGLDSRCRRVNCPNVWYDVDFPAVMEERRKYFAESDTYHMIGADLRENWLASIPSGGTAIVVMEGVSMYLKPEELKTVLDNLCSRFARVQILMDCYTEFAAKASRYKNPINDVGVTQVYGLDDPMELTGGNLRFCKAHEMTPADLTDQLRGMEKMIFRKL